MELSWTTFILEIINFLVLVWILKHFLYKPVLDVIARRRAAIDKTLDDARQMREEADNMREQYEGRLGEWEQERQSAREELNSQIEQERQQRLEKLDKEMADVKKRSEVAESRRLADAESKAESTALAQAARFATRLLEEGAGPDTEKRLIVLLIDELADLKAESAHAIQNQYGDVDSAVVSTAYPLDDELKNRLEGALKPVLSPSVMLEYQQDACLVAGIRITVGAWVLGANIQDELSGFARLVENG